MTVTAGVPERGLLDMTIGFRAFATFVVAFAGVIVSLSASAMEKDAMPRIVAASRFGLISARTPRLGPMLVRRGGYVAVKDMVRPRFVGGMIDLYPSTRTGFRVSVGDRYFAKTNFWRDAEQATGGLLFDPRMIRGGVGALQRTYRKKTPAAVVGYDTELAPGLVAGVEGGALLGRAINPGPRGGRSFRAEDNRMGAGLNPVATVAMRYAF